MQRLAYAYNDRFQVTVLAVFTAAAKASEASRYLASLSKEAGHAEAGRDITCQVEHIRDWKIDGWSRLILRVVHPRGAPLPPTEAGYLRHELEEERIATAGGPLAFLISWTDREASRYAQALYEWNQGDLFR